jgi:hypothetical protein
MQSHPIMLTLAEGLEGSMLLAIVSVCVGLGGIVLTIVSRLSDKSEKARDELARERHGEVCQKIELAHERVTETKKAVQDFRGEVAVEIAALHRADAAIALDLERRVAPIEGKLGLGRLGRGPESPSPFVDDRPGEAH